MFQLQLNILFLFRSIGLFVSLYATSILSMHLNSNLKFINKVVCVENSKKLNRINCTKRTVIMPFACEKNI